MQRSASWIDRRLRIAGVLAGFFLLYFVTAPPLMIAAWKQSGTMRVPPMYRPVMTIIESDFGAPLLWYFNNVWHAGIVLLGDDSPAWYVMLLYGLVGVVWILTVLLPVVRAFSASRNAA